MARKTCDGLTVIEVEPGAPVPAGIPAWAERCDVEEQPELSPALKPWVIGVGAVGALSSAITLAFFSHWGMAPLLPSLVVLWYGLREGVTRTVTPSPGGRYLAFEESTDGESALEAAGRVPVFLFGALLLLASILLFIYSGQDRGGLAVLAMGGCYFLYHSITGRTRADEAVEARTSLRFRALADPSRPLTEVLGSTATTTERSIEWKDPHQTAEGNATNPPTSPPISFSSPPS